jgi:hypothetical protein
MLCGRTKRATDLKAKKKGPLAGANGPSLGRKRPRRAAVNAMSATALQQYVSAPHKKQGVLTYFSDPPKKSADRVRAAQPNPLNGRANRSSLDLCRLTARRHCSTKRLAGDALPRHLAFYDDQVPR